MKHLSLPEDVTDNQDEVQTNLTLTVFHCSLTLYLYSKFPLLFFSVYVFKTACGVITELLPFGTFLHQIIKQ